MTNFFATGGPANLPPTCSVAFKEWAGICRALIQGRQSLTLRKGGIAEDSGSFEPEHRAFWLFPTRLHEPQQGLREEVPGADPPEPDIVPVQALATVDQVLYLNDPTLLVDLEPLHIWTEETVRKRFEYRWPGLWVLGVRIWAKPQPERLEDLPEYSGCRSWVPLAREISTEGLSPVVSVEEHVERMARLHELLGRSVPARKEGAGRAE